MEPNHEQESHKDLEETFKKVEEMLKRARESKGTAFQTPKGKTVDVYGAMEIIEGKPQVSLFEAEPGDIAWWKTESGTTGYFRIQEPYKKGDSLGGYGGGDLMIKRKEGHPIGNQLGKGVVLGAQFGTMLSIGRIVKGLPLEYNLEDKGKPKRYETTEVTDMGLIKAATLNSS